MNRVQITTKQFTNPTAASNYAQTQFLSTRKKFQIIPTFFHQVQNKIHLKTLLLELKAVLKLRLKTLLKD